MKTTKLIKTFAFEEENRSRIVLGTGARLNPTSGFNRLQLAGEAFSTDPDIFAKTWVTDPTTVQQWIGFEVIADHFKDEAGVVVTSLGFRLSDGTDEYFWNGSTWEVNAVDWNTEAEVAANIASFFPGVVQARKLQVVINLKTTNAAFSPYVYAVKVLYESTIEFQDDLIYRSLVPLIRSGLQPISRFMIQLEAAASTVDLKNDYKLETPYNVTGIDSVFNHTNDPEHLTDVFDSFDVGTQVITLTGAQAAGDVLFIRFVYEPEVAVTTSQDYTEIEKVPSIILDDINLIGASKLGQDDHVLNRATGEGWKIPAPLQGNLEVLLHLITDKGVDHQRLADEIKRFFANNPTIKSVGMDERFRLFLIDEFDMTTPANSGDLHTGRIRFRIENALFFVEDSKPIFGVKRFVMDGNMNATVEA